MSSPGPNPITFCPTHVKYPPSVANLQASDLNRGPIVSLRMEIADRTKVSFVDIEKQGCSVFLETTFLSAPLMSQYYEHEQNLSQSRRIRYLPYMVTLLQDDIAGFRSVFSQDGLPQIYEAPSSHRAFYRVFRDFALVSSPFFSGFTVSRDCRS